MPVDDPEKPLGWRDGENQQWIDITAGIADVTPSEGTLLGGLAVGLVAGCVMGLAMMIFSATQRMGFWSPMQAIAATLFGQNVLGGGAAITFVGVIIHLLVASAYGIFFTAFMDWKTPFRIAAAAGLAYGVCLWALMTCVALPFFNPLMRVRAGLAPRAWFAFHLIYGLALALAPALKKALAGKSYWIENTEEPRAA